MDAILLVGTYKAEQHDDANSRGSRSRKEIVAKACQKDVQRLFANEDLKGAVKDGLAKWCEAVLDNRMLMQKLVAKALESQAIAESIDKIDTNAQNEAVCEYMCFQ